ncbi:MAG: type II secretion system F family protein [Nocardioidaceae bacterium]
MRLEATLWAATLSFSAIWVALSRPALQSRVVRPHSPATGDSSVRLRLSAAHRRVTRVRWRTLSVATGVLVVWLWLRLGPSIVVILLALTAGTAAVRRLLTTLQLRRERRERQQAVLELCDALGAELRAGLPVTSALANAVGSRAEWSSLSSAALAGGDVVTALRRASHDFGAEDLRVLAAAWEVASHSGAALAVVLDRLAGVLRTQDEARAEVVAALGPPRATAKMLAVLPLFGIALGMTMGAQPLRFLFATPAGLVCLTTGVTLAFAGVCWVERLASTAEASA